MFLMCIFIDNINKFIVGYQIDGSGFMASYSMPVADFRQLSQEQFSIEVEKGLADFNAWRVVSSKQVRETLRYVYSKLEESEADVAAGRTTNAKESLKRIKEKHHV